MAKKFLSHDQEYHQSPALLNVQSQGHAYNKHCTHSHLLRIISVPTPHILYRSAAHTGQSNQGFYGESLVTTNTPFTAETQSKTWHHHPGLNPITSAPHPAAPNQMLFHVFGMESYVEPCSLPAITTHVHTRHDSGLKQQISTRLETLHMIRLPACLEHFSGTPCTQHTTVIPDHTLRSDTIVPSTPQSLGKRRYILTFLDPPNKYVIALEMRARSELLQRIPQTMQLKARYHARHPAKFISDNSRQCLSRPIQIYLTINGCNHTTTVPHYPDMNSLTQRIIRTVLNAVRAALAYYHLTDTY